VGGFSSFDVPNPGMGVIRNKHFYEKLMEE
jgi:hypothetical protein